MATSNSDFDSIFEKPGSDGQHSGDESLKRKAEEQAERENLRVYETMPARC